MKEDFKNLEIRRPTPWGVISLAGLALVIGCWPGAMSWLEYDRGRIAVGEVWLVWSGHLTHWSVEHGFWDVLMFLLLGGWVERRGRGRFWCVVIGSTTLISATLWWGRPEMIWYRGLSGVDMALASVGLAQTRSAWARAGLALLIAKIAWESGFGHSIVMHSDEEFVVVPMAHAVGLVVGLVIGGATRVSDPLLARSSNSTEKIQLNLSARSYAE